MTELFGMLKTYELEMIQAKERSSSYQAASTSYSTECKALKANPAAAHTRQAHQAQPKQQQQQQATPPTQTAACAAVGTADFDWSFQYEDIPANNQALMADTSEVPPQVYENLCTQACIDKVLGYRKHNQNLIDQNEEFHQMKSEFKKLKATRAELADQKVHVEKYEFASKKLQRLLDDQIHEKVTAGLGFQAEQPYNAVPPPADYVAIHEPSFNLSNLDMANRSLDPVVQETPVQECTTSSESVSTCSDSTETNKVSSPPTYEVIKANNPSPFIPSKTVPVSQPTKQIRISYPPEGRKLTVEKGQSSISTNSKPQSKSIQQRKVFDICHAPGERAPYVQKTLEEATFEHNKAHPWNFKDLFKRKDYQNAFEKTNKNKKVRSFEAKATQFRNSLSPPRKHLPKPQQSCIICGESDHFAANCKFNPINQVLHQIPLQQKPISKMKKGRHTSEIKPSAANKTAADQVRLKQTKEKPSSATKIVAAQVKPSAANKNVADQLKPKRPKDKSSLATKIAAAQVKPSASTKFAADKPKSSVATYVADKAKRAGKPPIHYWKAKIPP
ncbi:hypothetical protein L1987_57619 [Smallanthus sonchifolius]|uniref:Uncharacterized protein n=1 Tax=Smallanthus sonchifolius TaxID=185202 RepID=A0ACB9DE50_9ASTR|nr:hypothetical protein L1987_57619 [Smallanthus sonchifolius]